MPCTIKKSEAIERARKLYGAVKLGLRNTFFSNINAAKEVWWFEFPVAKMSPEAEEQINFLMYDHRTDEIHYLRVPTEYLRENLSRLMIRKDKPFVSLELSAERSRMFKDLRPKSGGVQFGQFKQ